MGAPTPEEAKPRFRRLVGATAWVLLAFAPRTRADDSLEAAIKAAYLYKFAPFIDWPSAPSPPAGAFAICVAGRDPFGSILDRAVSGQRIDGRPVVVTRMAVVQPNPPCQIVFLGGLRGQDLKDALKALRGSPVLTVTDEASADPGIVDFTIADGRVRFRLDARAAAENRLTISSKLLSLALAVNPKQGSKDLR
jgi:hypothetical protein